jgi:ankyrin repeat protein
VIPGSGPGLTGRKQEDCSVSYFRLVKLAALAALTGALMAPLPAAAQFSDSYKFLEAVKKKDGNKVTDALAEPGTTIINTRDVTTGQTALHIVVARRDRTWLEFLISKGANVNTRDFKGVTPLVLAANLNFIEGVEVLVAKGARVDDANDAGETPLISAVHNRNVPMMRLLLKAGANPDRADNSGRSARDYAVLEGRGSPLIAEIESKAKPQGAVGKPSYGPTL